MIPFPEDGPARGVVEPFLSDLMAVTDEVRSLPPTDITGMAAMYGMMGTMPDRRAAKEVWCAVGIQPPVTYPQPHEQRNQRDGRPLISGQSQQDSRFGTDELK